MASFYLSLTSVPQVSFQIIEVLHITGVQCSDFLSYSTVLKKLDHKLISN